MTNQYTLQCSTLPNAVCLEYTALHILALHIFALASCDVVYYLHCTLYSQSSPSVLPLIEVRCLEFILHCSMGRGKGSGSMVEIGA